MNTNEAAELLQRVARRYPGRVTISRDIQNQWARDLAPLTPEQADAAWDEHRRTCPHPCEPADLLAAHRHLTLDDTPPARPDLAPPHIDLPPARMSPDIAHAEIARMREILRPTSPPRGRR